MDCDFTYGFYRTLVGLLRRKGYEFSSYADWRKARRPVVMRHDIDCSPAAALRLAQIESGMGVRATYFVLVTSPFYNVWERETRETIRRISSLGHDIGLHFDEASYGRGCPTGGGQLLAA